MLAVVKKFKILFFCLAISACINPSWQGAKHTPQDDDKPKAQATPAPQPAAQSGGADDDYKKCGDFYQGKGVPKNDVEAFAHCKKAADAGNAGAMYNLGLFYQKGEGTAQSPNEAKKWFKAAADKGQNDAKFNLKQLQLAETGGLGAKAAADTAQDKKAEQPPKPPAASVNIAEYCLIAAQRGNPDPKCDAEQEKKSAVEKAAPANDLQKYIDAAKTGDPQAQNDLAVLYRRGLSGAKKDPAQAQKLFENSAAKSSTNAMLNLGSMYKEGDVQQNLELSYAWFNMASNRLPATDPKRLKAMESVKEVAKYLNNQQISSALDYAGKLDEKIPVLKDPAPAIPKQ